MKRQANILASVIQNFDTVDKVIETSMNSQGSAMAENAKWLDSIEGKTYEFTNALETMWSNFINAEVIKSFIDIGTELVQFLDTIPGKVTAVAAAFAGFAKFNGLSVGKLWGEGITSVGGYIQSLYQTNVTKSAFGIGPNLSTNAINEYANSVSALNVKTQAAMLASIGLNKAQITEALTHNQVTGAVIDETLAKMNLTKAQNVAAASTTKLSFSLKSCFAAIGTMFKMNPLGFILGIVSAIAMVAPLFEDVFKSPEEKIKDLTSEWEELSDTIETTSEDFKNLKSSANDIIPKFTKLAKGVDKFGKNMSLTDDEYKEFLSLNNQLAKMFPELNMGMDANGNAMLAMSYQSGTLEKDLWNLVDAEREVANQKIADTMPDVLDNITERNELYQDELEGLEERVEKYKDAKAQLDSLYSDKRKAELGDRWESQKDLITNGLSTQIQEAFGAFGDEADALAWQKLAAKFANEDGIIDWYQLLNSDEFEARISGFEKQIADVQTRISKQWAKLNPVITSWVQTTPEYQNFSTDAKLNSDLQTAAQAMIGNIDFSNLGLTTSEQIQNYITERILTPIKESSPKVQQAFADLMNIDSSKLSTRDYINKVTKDIQSIVDASEGAFTFDSLFKDTGYKDVFSDLERNAKIVFEALDDEIQNAFSGGKKNRTEIYEYNEAIKALKDNIYSLSPDEMTKALDYVKNYGIETWEELSEALENKTFSVVVDFETESESLEKLNAAIGESISASGLSSESITNLKNRYKDLEGYDPAQLFEETAHGIHLNTQEVNRLEAAYKQQNKTALDSKLKNLVDQYNKLNTTIAETGDASERALKYAQRNNVLQQINDTASLAAQYAGLTSAYNEWQQAQSNGNQRDMYDGVLSGKKELEEEMSRGWLDEGSRQYLELLSGKDLSTSSWSELLSTYQDLNAEIGAGHNVWDFFTTDDSGNSTTDGIYNFFDAVMAKQQELGKNWVSIGEDGSYTFDFGVNGDQAIADALGISQELVQILLRAAKDAGFDINLDGAYSSLADLQDQAEVTSNRLKELGATDYSFNITSTNVDDIEKQIERLKTAIQNLYNEDGTLKVGVEEADVENAKTLLATLIYQKQSLDTSAILSVDVNADTATNEIESAIAKAQELKAAANEIEVSLAVGADPSAAEANFDEIIGSLTLEEREVLVDLGVNLTASPEEMNAQISAITQDMMINVGLNPQLIEGTEDYQAKGVVVWENNLNAVTAWASQQQEATGMVKWDNDVSDVQTNFTATGTVLWTDTGGPGQASGTAHASGTAFAGGTSGDWRAPKDEMALTGELGPEILVRNGRWMTIGEHGAEFNQIKKGDIIFNHKQSEQLLKNGRITSRGKAYASGTAFSDGSGPGRGTIAAAVIPQLKDTSSSLGDAADSVKESSEKFKEVFDWIEVRLEEINEHLDLMDAKVENAKYYSDKNAIIDDMIETNKILYENLIAGAKEYAEYSETLLSKIPEEYREAVKNGTIDIEGFSDSEKDKKILEAIQEYRDWVQKGADATQQAEEVLTTIRDLAIEKFDNAFEAGDVRASVEDSQTNKLQNAVDYDEERGLITSDEYYLAMMENSNKKIEYLTEARKAMQQELNAAVEAGHIQKGSNEWYELLDQMYEVDAQIDEATIELEEFQNAINDIYWENFDELINRIDYIQDETQNLIDLMDSEDMVITPKTEDGWSADEVEWSKEGLASLGLYAQQMEIAEYKAKQYAVAIDDLTKEYEAGHYSENEYLEKLNELKNSQYESIEAYYDAQDAIKELNQTRIDSIKKGIEKEIDAYSKLIEKKKEALDADKDMHDFQKDVMQQQKEISDIERKLIALSTDTSIAAAAKRKQLEAELAEARGELEETYYDRSIEDQQNALDKELENFQKEKDEEIIKMEEYLEDIKQVVADSLATVQANAFGIYDTLNEKANEYDLTLSEAILSPWQDGALAVGDYQNTFDTNMSSTMDQLDALKTKWQEIIDKMAEAGKINVDAINKENASYGEAEYKGQSQTTNASASKSITIGGKIKAGGATIYSDSSGSNPSAQYYDNDPIYTVLDEQNGYLLVRHHSLSSGETGWFKKSDVQAYAKGTIGVKENQLALIDELGEELILRAHNGRLTYMEKDTGVIPADLTANLMEWGKLDPSIMLDQNRPQIIPSSSVVNNNTEIHIDASVSELIHVEQLNGNNPAEITKIIDKAWDKRMKELNGFVRKYSR